MGTANIVLLVLGIAAMVMGYYMIANEKFAAWSLSTGRAKIWVKILGEARAMKTVKYVFGPFTVLFGLLMALAGAFSGPIH